MFKELKSLTKNNILLKSDLMNILKKYSKTISVFDLMDANSILLEDIKFAQKQYQKEFKEVYIKYFMNRVKNISEDNEDYSEELDIDKFNKSLAILEGTYNQSKEIYGNNSKFSLIQVLISLYSTFILEESIHPEGTPFPGSLKIKKINGIYYCPVKKAQENTPGSLCKLCLAVQDDSD